jgi:hypothetical protein
VWERLDQRSGPAVALTDLPIRDDMKPADLSTALGRRWRKEHPDFWGRLSPLGTGRPSTNQDETPSTPLSADPESEAFVARLRQLREAQLEEARRDAAAFSAAAPRADLRSPPISGSMDDREDDVEEEPWQ